MEFALSEAPTTIVIVAAALIGLCVGSFLNVVIYRLPIMMQRDWAQQCAELCEESGGNCPAPEHKPFNLVTPNSHCPKCDRAIKPWENIPLISYLLQRGKCKGCDKKISIRYPLVELVTALLTVAVFMTFTLECALFITLFVWALIALGMIDYDTQLLPDSITLPLLWLGLLAALNLDSLNLENSVIGAMAGYLTLWSVYWLFKLLTGKEGMGYGDFKLLAALGAWFGAKAIPAIIILSSVSGIIIAGGTMLLAAEKRGKPVPFGPFLACAGIAYLFFGADINALILGQ